MLPFQSKIAFKSLAAGAPPQTPLGELAYTIDEIHDTLLRIIAPDCCPFLSKIHQNRWPVGPLGPTSILGPSAPSPPLPEELLLIPCGVLWVTYGLTQKIVFKNFTPANHHPR